MYTDSAASVHETEKEPMAETADNDYRLVEKSEIPDDEKDMPALAKAFRILSDCDIYEKKQIQFDKFTIFADIRYNDECEIISFICKR